VRDAYPAQRQLILQFVQRQVRVLSDPLDDEGAMRLKYTLAMAAHLARRH
jgi:hypothetical protein